LEKREQKAIQQDEGEKESDEKDNKKEGEK